MAEYNPSKIIKDGNTYNFRDTTKIPLAGSNQISGSLVPSTDGTVNLGSSTAQWNNAYIKSLTINGTQFLPSDYATLSGLSTVATSGSYNDLSNKPTIPTVNNGTLTIQQNGTTVDTFTANSSSDKTVNIQCVDLTNNQTVGGIKTFSNAPVVGSINLDGKTIDTDANGNMTFNGNITDTIEEQGDGYIRYSNGIQICWGGVGIGPEAKVTINFPKSFSWTPSVSLTSDTEDVNSIVTAKVSSQTLTVCRNFNYYGTYYIVIGMWK